MVMIADMGDGEGPGSVQLTVRPEKLREAAKGFAELADELDRSYVILTGLDRG